MANTEYRAQMLELKRKEVAALEKIAGLLENRKEVESEVPKKRKYVLREAPEVQELIDDVLEFTGARDDVVLRKDIWGVYQEWCDDKGITPKEKMTFGKILSRAGIDNITVRDEAGHVNRGARGWKFRPTAREIKGDI